jgi:hypothetical protein
MDTPEQLRVSQARKYNGLVVELVGSNVLYALHHPGSLWFCDPGPSVRGEKSTYK